MSLYVRNMYVTRSFNDVAHMFHAAAAVRTTDVEESRLIPPTTYDE